jgi:hypothetical protein
MIGPKKRTQVNGVALTQKEARDIHWPGMEARYICHVVYVNSPHGDGLSTRINFSPSRASKDLRVAAADDNMTFWASRELCHSLTDSVHAKYVGSAPRR